MAELKTCLLFSFVLISVVNVKCSLSMRPQTLMDEAHNVEQLLRGSHEEKDDDVVMPMNDFKNIEPNPPAIASDDYDSDSDNDTTTTANYATDTRNTDAEKIVETTTRTFEVPTTVNAVEVPEALGLKTEQSEADDPKSDNHDEKKDAVDVTTLVMPTEMTDAVTDHTMTLIDNNAFNTNMPQEDAVNISTSNNSEAAIKQEPTAAPLTTTRGTKDDSEVMVESRISSDIDPEMENTGQRSPKTDADSKTPIDKRNHESKPRPTPAASKPGMLRSWLEDPWLRPPPAVVVPLRQSALRRALAVWNALKEVNVTDLVIVGYDANGVNWRSRYALQPSTAEKTVEDALSKLLRKYQGVHNYPKGDGTMRALTSSAKLVPYDSALFLITDRGAADADRLPLAVKALVHKRLKVYTIWTDPNYPSVESEDALQDLRNVSSHTEGEVLPFSTKDLQSNVNGNQIALEDDYMKLDTLDHLQPRAARFNSDIDQKSYDMLLVRRGGGEAISLGIPVENGVTALRVIIEGTVDHAVLYPPNDAPQIDLYNETTVRGFSAASRITRNDPTEVMLIFPGANKNDDSLSVVPMSPSPASAHVGVWHVSVRCDACEYRLVVLAHSTIHFSSEALNHELLRLRINGPFSSVRETTLVDEFGNELAQLPFSSQPKAGEDPVGNFNRISDLQSDVPFPSVKASRLYTKAVGRDNGDNAFVRLYGPLDHAEVRMSRSASDILIVDDFDGLELQPDTTPRRFSKLLYNESSIVSVNRAASQVVNQLGQILTAVQIGLATKLYGAPGTNLQLHFEVTNFREQQITFSFEATGQLKFLTGISPSRQTITPGQTVNVVVSALVSATAEPGAKDLITFKAYAASNTEQVSIQAFITVLNPGQTLVDTWPPTMTHTFQGSCIGNLAEDTCNQHSWTTTITAKDTASGLLRLTSSPVGLVYDSNFVSGTRDAVRAVYRATCCQPRLSVTAVDAMGNAYSYNIDISTYLTGASIAAIVLGVLFAIILIGILIGIIYVCVKRRKDSADIPSYQTSRSRVMN